MVRVAGEVSDGWIVHPLHSADYVHTVALPMLEQGLARAGRHRASVAVACQTITIVGSSDEEIARARMNARGQVAGAHPFQPPQCPGPGARFATGPRPRTTTGGEKNIADHAQMRKEQGVL